ncbi:uncharacterized protein LOC133393050 [Anopheles gambiae]|uniref:uncharacterized protein LOC133393050 n=1 Tax=Anopheles gambiae TaxID=7165 RepID=UPI002AC90C62|nr:uncharacterized protein LOC133393050 [Anopheles gambiae]
MEYSKRIRKTGMLYRAQATAAKKRKLEESKNSAPVASKTSEDILHVTPNNDNQDRMDNPAINMVNEEVNVYEEDAIEGESEDETGEEPDFENMSMSDCLKFWALSTNAPHASINMLLKIFNLKTAYGLPKDARTFLNTCKYRPEITNVKDGKFWYRGVEESMTTHLRFTKVHGSELSLNIFVDGLPLHKSSSSQFWPILANIHEMPHISPFIVGIFHGTSKPDSLNDYLTQLVEELNDLMNRGIILNNKKYDIIVRAIIADSPARSFIKGVAYFNSKFACLKCTCEGEFNEEGKTTIFKGINAPKRTDEHFRGSVYAGHTKQITPLLDLNNFDIIKKHHNSRVSPFDRFWNYS